MSFIQKNLSGGGLGIQLPPTDVDPTDDDALLGPILYNKGGNLLLKARSNDPSQVLGAPSSSYDSTKSFQGLSYDLNLGVHAGKDDPSTAFLAAIMGNIHGDSLLKTGDYLAGVIGADSITGAQATKYPKGGVLGQISDTVTVADGAVIAEIDGDSGLTKANAAFKAMMRNSTPGSGFDFGVDLYDPAFGSYQPLAILKALLRTPNQVCILENAGVPVDGGAGTGQGFAGPGSLCIDYTNKKMYINSNTAASPTWKIFTSA